jgi:lipopolysaccharide export system protein LptC
MPSLREYILVLVLGGLGLLAWWLGGELKTPAQRTGTQERRPDYTVDELTASMMDESGRLHRRLTASEARHYPDNSGSELDDPRLLLFEESAPPWVIRSARGWISEDGDELLLQGPVFIDRTADAQTRPVHLKTWELYVKPREDYAQTDQPVHLTSGADWLSSANGARVWFGKTLRIVLLGRARAQIAVR